MILAVFTVSTNAGDWPQFHGPNRDNKSMDKGLLKAWPEGGPTRLWETPGIGDGMFYLYSDDGDVALTRPTPTGFEVAGRLTLKDPGERPTWAYPVVHGGRLYLRYGDKLSVYDVTERAD